ncbi:MAG: YdcF family protein [Proteobacteria bacterium]|nr:YdcF family protein [Burkholderiales bacterium]
MIGRHRVLGVALIISSMAALTLASTPFIAERLLRGLETPALSALTPARPLPERRQAIVILGGGLSREAPEYGGDTVNAATLERLRYGAWLHRQTGLPMLVSGGKPMNTRLSEAETMRVSLETDFRARPRWVEGDSLNTRENAERARAVLARESIESVYLVTHAWHMPRARRAFERAGFEVIAAPTGYTALSDPPFAWVPSALALRNTHIALREGLGEAWYRLDSQRLRARLPESAP